MKTIILFMLLSSMLNCAYAGSEYDWTYRGEFYHTPESFACMVADRPSAYVMGEHMAQGNAVITHEFDAILESFAFVSQPEPIHLAYAFFLIADRIGDTRAQEKLEWLEPSLRADEIDIIKTAIYGKYSQPYLSECFSEDGTIPPITISDVYPLYFDE